MLSVDCAADRTLQAVPDAERPTRVWRVAIFLSACLFGVQTLAGGVAWAQDDDEGDPSSRARPSRADDADDGDETTVDLEYEAGAFGGTYLQDDQLGLLVDLEGQARLEHDAHRFQLTGTYLYDPFSTKTFNFEEDAREESSTRLVQSMHEIGGELEWRTDWRPTLRSEIGLGSGYRWPDVRADQRWSLELDGALRWGADWRGWGPYTRLSGEYFRRIYPHYRVADRSLDQQGAEGRLDVGYSFGRSADLELAYQLRMTDYLDARYDRELSDGQIVRADASKLYLRQALIAEAVTRPSTAVRLALRYTFQHNDSRHYDRRMTGRTETGALESRFIRDYYDYDRHRLKATARWSTPIGVRLELFGEYWVRLFDTYEARDVDNRWLGDTRVDHDLEAGLEASYRFYDAGDHRIDLVAFVSHLRRRSNMERELSFATNYDVTRMFLGIEAHN